MALVSDPRQVISGLVAGIRRLLETSGDLMLRDRVGGTLRAGRRRGMGRGIGHPSRGMRHGGRAAGGARGAQAETMPPLGPPTS